MTDRGGRAHYSCLVAKGLLTVSVALMFAPTVGGCKTPSMGLIRFSGRVD